MFPEAFGSRVSRLQHIEAESHKCDVPDDCEGLFQNREKTFQNIDSDVGVAFDGVADPQTNHPNEQIPCQFLRPRKRVTKYAPHDDLKAHDDHHSGQERHHNRLFKVCVQPFLRPLPSLNPPSYLVPLLPGSYFKSASFFFAGKKADFRRKNIAGTY
jgi:hypothetical protein